MNIALVTGAGGIVGAESCRQFVGRGFKVIGIDNDMRRTLFGDSASIQPIIAELKALGPSYEHHSIDIRDVEAVNRVFQSAGGDISLVIHAAGQPSHEWAAKDPMTDFAINATGTLTVLEAARRHCPKASFIYPSTNAVYGDRPNQLPLRELETRFEIDKEHPFAKGIDESMTIDQTLHSLFGVSKTSADLMVQEYGRCYGMSTVCFRAGCLTSPGHAGTEWHGFLNELIECILLEQPYTVFGYKGKQVRDNLHCADFVSAFWEFHQKPTCGAVYNIGGGKRVNCSILEAIKALEERMGRKLQWNYDERSRIGDRIWYVSDTSAFEGDYPNWERRFSMESLFDVTIEAWVRRLESTATRA